MFSEPTFLPQHRMGKMQNILLCTPAKIPESPASQPVLSKEPSMGNAHLKLCRSNSVPCVLVSLDQSLGCYNLITLCSCQKIFFLSPKCQREEHRFPRNSSELSLRTQECKQHGHRLCLNRGGEGQVHTTDEIHSFHKDSQHWFLWRIIWKINLPTQFLSALQLKQ